MQRRKASRVGLDRVDGHHEGYRASHPGLVRRGISRTAAEDDARQALDDHVVPVEESCVGSVRPSVALVAASLELLGGQGIQAHALAENLRAEGERVKLVPINPAFPRGLRSLRRVAYLRTIVNEILYLPSLVALRGAEVVHIFSASYFSFLLGPAPALLAAKLMRKRVILNYHSGEAQDHLARWGVLVHPWLRLADEIVVPSDYLRRVFARHGYRTRVIPNVVDVSRFQYRERTPLAPRFLSIRNLEPHYGVDQVIRAFASIRRRYPKATLVVGGGGSQRGALERLVQELALDGVRFIGSYSPTQAPGIYGEADIMLNASVVDNQPVSVLEAFASGLPVISTPTGDIGAMLQGGAAGVVVMPGDPEAMAAAAVGLLEDPLRARSLARCARNSLERFSWAHVSTRWATAYGWGRG